MRILFLSRWYPDPPDNGSKIRVFNLLHGLCEQHQVTLVSFLGLEESVSNAFPAPAPEEIHVCRYRDFTPSSRRAILGYLSSTPRYLIDTHSSEMERVIRRVTQRTRFDLVIASQISMASYHHCFEGIPAIFEEAELGIYWPYDDYQGGSLGLRKKLTWLKHRKFMERLLTNFRFCTVASELECNMLTRAVPAYQNVHVIPNSVSVSLSGKKPASRIPQSLVFAGSLSYAPNYDAMTWFVREVYPAVKAEMPGVRLTITGKPGSQPLPHASNVELTGVVPDVQPIVAASAVSLAPLRIGGGTRLKILESIALRTPVVATSKGAEGLEARNGEHLLIADTPREFADAVLCLLRNPDYASSIAENAYRLFQSRYDWKIVLPQFLRLADLAVAS